MSDPTFTLVSELAHRLGKHVAIYDLEGTTFRGVPDFGITEVACFVVAPTGPGVLFSSLIDPERPISKDAQRITGISQDMVRGQQTWGVRYAKLFADMAAGQTWLGGFNNVTFDNPAVQEMGERYGVPIPDFKHTFDVRRLHLKLSGAKSQRGTLSQVAQAYGVTARGDLHRAVADVILTLELFNGVLETYGLEAVMNQLQPAPEGARDKLSSGALVKYVRSRRALTVAQAAEAFHSNPQQISFEIGKCIDERMLDPEVFSAEAAQEWLRDALVELPPSVLEEGKLRPMFDSLKESGLPDSVDYIQLRIALLRQGLAWTSLKPQ